MRATWQLAVSEPVPGEQIAMSKRYSEYERKAYLTISDDIR
jgi:hypothetical protein